MKDVPVACMLVKGVHWQTELQMHALNNFETATVNQCVTAKPIPAFILTHSALDRHGRFSCHIRHSRCGIVLQA